jgi:predicted type IV restriction endonuclease
MKEITSCIEQLRLKLDRHRKENLKEYPTRTIFIDPLLQSLGWDVRGPDEVQLEYPTIDGKSVDYAPKLIRKPVLFIEAKPLNDPLIDVKAITQVVGYAANAGVEWCILTNGVAYKVYRSTEKAEAPDKLLFEVSIDPKESEGKSAQQIAEQFSRFSRDAMAQGVLDEIGEQVFTRGRYAKL